MEDGLLTFDTLFNTGTEKENLALNDSPCPRTRLFPTINFSYVIEDGDIRRTTKRLLNIGNSLLKFGTRDGVLNSRLCRRAVNYAAF